MKLIKEQDLINQMEKDFSGNFLYEKGFCLINDMSFMDCFLETLENIPDAKEEKLNQLNLYKVAFDLLLKDDCRIAPGNWTGTLDELYYGRKDYYMDLAKKELLRQGERT
jgi:hypothetical protein